MNRFAEMLDRLAYEHGRNAKLRLMTEFFRTTPIPSAATRSPLSPARSPFRMPSLGSSAR